MKFDCFAISANGTRGGLAILLKSDVQSDWLSY